MSQHSVAIEREWLKIDLLSTPVIFCLCLLQALRNIKNFHIFNYVNNCFVIYTHLKAIA